MRVQVFLQSAAIKILRQKLSQVSFSSGFPFRFKMIEVLFTTLFYLVLLATLGLFALLVRLIGSTEDAEPEQDDTPPPKQQKFLLALKDKPENNSVEDNIITKENFPENHLELTEHTETDTSPAPLDEIHSEAGPEVVISEQVRSCKPHEAYSSILSPLTLFLLGGGLHSRVLSSENRVRTKLWRQAQKID